MAKSRKPHVKTRLGCGTCKSRRVKCDLGSPSCNNCLKRGLKCIFPAVHERSLQSQSRNPSFGFHVFRQTSPVVLSVELRSPTYLDAVPLDELSGTSAGSLQSLFKRLIQQFIIRTSYTLAPDAITQPAWPELIPKFATSQQYVIRGMLAITSLHVARYTQDATIKYSHIRIAVEQMNLGLRQYRHSLQDITPRNAEALFAFSTMLTTFIFATAGDDCANALSIAKDHTTSRNERFLAINDAKLQVIAIIRSLMATKVVVMPVWHLVSDGLLSPRGKRDWWPTDRIPVSPWAIEEDQKLKRLDKMWISPGRKYEYYFDTLASVLKNLRECFALVSLLTPTDDSNGGAVTTGPLSDWGSVYVWAVAITPEYLSLLEEQQVEAWVILAHYAILTSRIHDLCWTENMAENIVATAAYVLGEENWSWIEWPVKAVGLDLNSLRLPV